jgi:hypothetical protein
MTAPMRHPTVTWLPPDEQREAEERAIRRLETAEEDLSFDELDRIVTTLERSREAYCQSLALGLRRCMAQRAAYEMNRDARRLRLIANIDRASTWAAAGIVVLGALWLLIHGFVAVARLW